VYHDWRNCSFTGQLSPDGALQIRHKRLGRNTLPIRHPGGGDKLICKYDVICTCHAVILDQRVDVSRTADRLPAKS
jgi:hypothetical protein